MHLIVFPMLYRPGFGVTLKRDNLQRPYPRSDAESAAQVRSHVFSCEVQHHGAGPCCVLSHSSHATLVDPPHVFNSTRPLPQHASQDQVVTQVWPRIGHSTLPHASHMHGGHRPMQIRRGQHQLERLFLGSERVPSWHTSMGSPEDNSTCHHRRVAERVLCGGRAGGAWLGGRVKLGSACVYACGHDDADGSGFCCGSSVSIVRVESVSCCGVWSWWPLSLSRLGHVPIGIQYTYTSTYRRDVQFTSNLTPKGMNR